MNYDRDITRGTQKIITATPRVTKTTTVWENVATAKISKIKNGILELGNVRPSSTTPVPIDSITTGNITDPLL